MCLSFMHVFSSHHGDMKSSSKNIEKLPGSWVCIAEVSSEQLP